MSCVAAAGLRERKDWTSRKISSRPHAPFLRTRSHPPLQSLPGLRVELGAGDDENGKRFEGRVLPDLIDDLKPVHRRQQEVEQDDVVRDAPEHRERLGAVARGRNVEAVLIEHLHEQVASLRIVLDHQDARREVIDVLVQQAGEQLAAERLRHVSRRRPSAGPARARRACWP